MAAPRLRVALLCHFPPAWFARYSIQFEPSAVQGEIANSAFSTVEGVLVESLLELEQVELHVVSFSKAVTGSQIVGLGGGSRLHVLQARRGTGMPVGWLPRFITVRRLLRKICPDIVHGMRNIEGYGYFAAFSGYPHVVTPQELLEQVPVPARLKIPFKLARLLERGTFKHARHLIAISDHIRRRLEERSHAQFHPIPNPAGEVFFDVQKRPDAEGVLFVGRISPEKGLLDVLKALRLARAEGKKIPARIVGGASGVDGARHLEECVGFAQSHLAENQVRFLGWRSSAEIAALHATSEIFVMPSLAAYEGMPVVLAESLAAGTPAVVFDHGPMPDLVRHGHSGLVVPPGDVEALSNAITALLADKQKLRRMGANARGDAARYRKEAVAQAHLELYRDIAGLGA